MGRFLIEWTNQDRTEAILSSMAFLVEEMKKSQTRPDILIVVDGKENFESYFSDIFPKTIIAHLRGGREVLYHDVTLQLATPRERFYGSTSNALVIFPSQRALDLVDNANCEHHLVVLTLANTVVTKWINTWSPILLHFQGQKLTLSAPNPIALDPVVLNALETFTLFFKKRNEPLDDFERHEVVETFRLLIENRIVYDPVEVRAFLVRKGWGTRRADEAQEIAVGIMKGKRYRTSGERFSNKMLETWRKKAAEK